MGGGGGGRMKKNNEIALKIPALMNHIYIYIKKSRLSVFSK